MTEASGGRFIAGVGVQVSGFSLIPVLKAETQNVAAVSLTRAASTTLPLNGSLKGLFRF